MDWWLWAVGGIALLAIEIATPGGLVALFFGAGALLVAPLAALGVPPVWQWVVFSVASVASLALLRRTLLDRMPARTAHAVDRIEDEEAVLLEDLVPGGEARAELRGVPWRARTAAGVALPAGCRCSVERVDGVTLWVRSK